MELICCHHRLDAMTLMSCRGAMLQWRYPSAGSNMNQKTSPQSTKYQGYNWLYWEDKSTVAVCKLLQGRFKVDVDFLFFGHKEIQGG